MSLENNREKGAKYEEKAEQYLISEGYTILERNYRRKTGEIDLIAREKGESGTIVFFEIKYRKSAKNGLPFEAVSAAKQRRIYKTAEWYLLEKKLHGGRFRFDVISILNNELTHLKNAFGGF